MTTVVLSVLAVAFAGPVPAALAGWERLRRTLRRTPGAAMLLWQAVALAAVLAALGAGLSLATASGRSLAAHGGPAAAVTVLAVLLTALVLGRLLLSGHRIGSRLRALRRRHRRLVDVLADERGLLRVLPGELPLAYCVPGLLGGRVVVSEATYRALDEEQRAVVLTHERAHLRARHDLVLEAFTVLHDAFPRVVTSARALAEVRLLVEVLADHAARSRHGAAAVLRTLQVVVGAGAPEAALGAGGDVRPRVDALLDDRDRRAQAALVVAAAVAVLLLPTLLVVVPWLAGLAG